MMFVNASSAMVAVWYGVHSGGAGEGPIIAGIPPIKSAARSGAILAQRESTSFWSGRSRGGGWNTLKPTLNQLN